jgi:hypothetical protein
VAKRRGRAVWLFRTMGKEAWDLMSLDGAIRSRINAIGGAELLLPGQEAFSYPPQLEAWSS